MSSESPQNKSCSQCGEEVPAGFGFCGTCGAKLDAAPLFSKDSRERRQLENDIAEAVADRLIKWGTRVGKLFLAALAIALVSLGAWGIWTISDVKRNLEDIAAQTKSEADGLKKQVDSAISEVADLRKQYKALNDDLDHYRQVNRKIESLQKDLQTINGQIANWYDSLESEVFDPSSADRVHFTVLTLDEKKALFASQPDHGLADQPLFRAVITLKKTPIPASVRINRYYLSIPPDEIKVAGRQVSFVTRSDKFVGAPYGAPIYVQYHPTR